MGTFLLLLATAEASTSFSRTCRHFIQVVGLVALIRGVRIEPEILPKESRDNGHPKMGSRPSSQLCASLLTSPLAGGTVEFLR